MTEKMKAIVLRGIKDIKIEEYDIPEIGPREVLYEVHAVSLCTVEQRTFTGAKNFGFPFLGGHENSGVVVKVGEDVQDFKVGDNVIATYNYCGECEYCKTGRGTKCTHSMKTKKRLEFDGTIIGGGMAQYLRVPSQQLVKVNKDIPLYKFALTEPLACCLHSISKARVQYGESVVVIGAGIMGLFHSKLAQLRGAYVIVSDPDPIRREKALKLGAHEVIDPTSEDAVTRVKELTGGTGADVVANTIAFTGIWNDAIAMLAPYGRLLAYSSQDEKVGTEIDFGVLHSKEWELIGTVSPSLEANLRASKLIGYGIIDPDDYIDDKYTLENAQDAFVRASQPDSYRVIIEPRK